MVCQEWLMERHLFKFSFMSKCNLELVSVVPVSDAPAKTQNQIEAEGLGVSEGKLIAMRQYAREIVQQAKAKGEKIKESTVRSKVLKKFNIKLQ